MRCMYCRNLGTGRRCIQFLRDFSLCQCAFRGQTEWSGWRGGWFIFLCKSWIQRWMQHCLYKTCIKDQRVCKMWRFQVGGSLVVWLILVSCFCVKIGICYVPWKSTRLLMLLQRPSPGIEIGMGQLCLLVWHPLWSRLMSQSCQWWSWLRFFLYMLFISNHSLGGVPYFPSMAMIIVRLDVSKDFTRSENGTYVGILWLCLMCQNVFYRECVISTSRSRSGTKWALYAMFANYSE